MIGIEFTLKDGSKDCYDPINYPDDFTETDSEYVLNMAHRYTISKESVLSIRHYNLCEDCGCEIAYDNSGCQNPCCENNEGKEW